MTDRDNEIKWRKYFYPGTEVLMNNFGIKDYDMLKEAEATNSFQRLLELQEKPIDSDFGKKHLNAIHKYLFEDIYPFAGNYRDVNMMKKEGTFLNINTVLDIDRYLDELFEEVERQMMQCRSKHDFAEMLSKIYTQLIYCHPYREGNGRTIREFLREFSKTKSKEIGLEEVELDWKKINREELNNDIAFAHIFPGNTAMLFENALTPVEKQDYK